MTLKSDLVVVELFDVEYYCDLEMSQVIESGTIWKLGYGSLFAFHSNSGRIFNHFRDIHYSVSKNGVTLKTRLGVIQGNWKWRCSIDHMRRSIGRPL